MSNNTDRNQTAAPPEPAFALIDASGLLDPMSVRRHASTVEVYGRVRRLEGQGGFRVIPVMIVSNE